MPHHDPNHLQWDIPTVQSGPDPAAAPSTATAVGPPPPASRVGPPKHAGSRTRLGRRVAATAIGLSLLVGGGAGGFALLADGGADRGRIVTVADPGSGRPDGARVGRGG